MKTISKLNRWNPYLNNRALNNLKKVLKFSIVSLADIVCLRFNTTGIGAFHNDAVPVYRSTLEAAACKPSETLLGVTGLFQRDLMIEIEATAIV